jgi:hypothetical protein
MPRSFRSGYGCFRPAFFEELVMNIRHIACLGVLIASVALAGCNGADEAKARNDCDKMSAAKAEDCAGQTKQTADKNFGGIAKALKQ